MSNRYVSSRWSIELARGWTAEPRADFPAGERTELVAIVPESKDALLRLTPDERGLIGAAEWVYAVGRIALAKGRRVSTIRCGDFVGNTVAFSALDERLRGWALFADSFPIDVNYRCKIQTAGRDDAVVDAMMSSLRQKPKVRSHP
jgi:hypothetical protein